MKNIILNKKYFFIIIILFSALIIALYTYNNKYSEKTNHIQNKIISDKYTPEWIDKVLFTNEIQELETKGGIKFWYYRRNGTPKFTIQMSSYVDDSDLDKNTTKYSLYDQGHNKVRSYVAKMFFDETNNMSKNKLKDFINSKSIKYNYNIYSDGMSLGLSNFISYLDEVTPVYKEIVQNPVFSEKEFNKIINIWIESWKANTNNVKRIIKYQANQHTYEKHRKNKIGKEGFELISFDDVSAYYNKLIRKNELNIVVVSNIPKQKVIDTISTIFDGFPEEYEDIKTYEYDVTVPKVRQNIEFDYPQTTFLWSSSEFKTNKKTDLTFEILHNILISGLNSPMMEYIRTKKGLVYSIDLYMQSLNNDKSAIVGLTEVDNDKADELEQALEKSFEMIKGDTVITKQSVLLAKTALINKKLYELLDNDSIAISMLEAKQNEFDKDKYFQKQIEYLNNITVDDVKELANKMEIKMLITGGKPNLSNMETIKNPYEEIVNKNYK